MKTLQGMLGVYALIGVVYAVMRHFNGNGHVLTASDFGGHVAHALVWPAFMFPAFGKFLGGVVLLLVVCAWALSKLKN